MYGGLTSKIVGSSNAVQGTQPGEDKVSTAEVKYSEKQGRVDLDLHLVGLAQRRQG
jgi:hypothetical protein